jgi:dipeptidyl aminopeptidase/acylaminoacyl peptidase
VRGTYNVPMVRFFASVSLSALCFAQTPTIEQSLNWKTVASPEISPDARFVAWTETEADWDDNEFKTQIWIWSNASGRSYRLTRGKKSASDPAFAPDGRLAFVSDRDGKRQIYLIAPEGGEAVRLTDDEAGVTAYRWSPDGKRIAYTSNGPESKPLKDRKQKYGDFEVVREDSRQAHLYLVDAPQDVAKPLPGEALTSGAGFSIGGFAWAPDARRIAFSAARNSEIVQGHTADLYTVSVDTKAVRKIVEREGADTNPAWSPDGRFIAFQASAWRPFDCCFNTRLAMVRADGGTVSTLTDSFDENPSLEGWGPDGIYFSGLQKTLSHLYRLDPQTKAIQRVLGSEALRLASVSLARDFRTVAFTAAEPGRLAEVFLASPGSSQPRRLSDASAQVAAFRLASRELISWKSDDGAVIEGILIKPADYDPARKYPLLVVIHGGPTGIDRPVLAPDRYYPVEMFAAKGALILRPNYRGSAGYGEQFRSLNVRNLGEGDKWDVLSGVDSLIAKGIVDPARLGAMGWSQGGYISAYLTTTSSRFKAISVGAGISDWMTYYVNTDITTFTRNYLKATPWDDPEVYRKTSPISFVKSARTPTLIQHGELDKRVPIPNGYELRQALEDRGVPVRMVVYKGFGHGITKPKQMMHVMEDNLRWFSQYIWNEESK